MRSFDPIQSNQYSYVLKPETEIAFLQKVTFCNMLYFRIACSSHYSNMLINTVSSRHSGLCCRVAYLSSCFRKVKTSLQVLHVTVELYVGFTNKFIILPQYSFQCIICYCNELSLIVHCSVYCIVTERARAHA